MPGKSPSFTPSSILFRPRRNAARGVRVEAPGTAPGSDRFIATAVYHHSRHEDDALNIGVPEGNLKGRGKGAVSKSNFTRFSGI